MAERMKQLLSKPIQMADQLSKTAEEAQSFKQECMDLKKQAEKLASLLRQAARTSGGLYERPAVRIIGEMNQVLEKALLLVTKCSQNALKRVFTITSAAAFRKMSALLDNSIGDMTWLLNVSGSSDDLGLFLGIPPIATNDPMLGMVWEQIARLQSGTPEEKADVAASLVSLAKDNERNGKLIVEEGGTVPLLKLLKDGTVEAQETAAKALGKLGRDPESVKQMVKEGVSSVFQNVLKDGPMKVQAMVSWAISELISNDPESQEHFTDPDMIRALVGHLAFETVPVHSKYTVPKASMHSVVTKATQAANMSPAEAAYAQYMKKESSSPSAHLPSMNLKGREAEDPVVKLSLKTEAARALWMLVKNNPKTCKNVTESKALLCFATLLEKGKGEIQRNSAMAIMEIASVAEDYPDLRRSAFKTNSPAAKALVEQLVRIIRDPDSELLIPCVRTVGCLARTFPARETRLIEPLVRHLDHRELRVSREAAIALNKFACTENYNHVEHSKAIIDNSGVPHLIQLVYFGEDLAQVPALVLLCYLALHVGDNEALAKAEALSALEWASKQSSLTQDPLVERLLPDAKSRLELYQSRGSRFH